MTDATSIDPLAEAAGFTPTWWTFVLLGVVAVIFGICCVAFTPWVVLFLGYFIGAMVMIHGAMLAVQGVRSQQGAGTSIALIVLGVIAFLLGLYVFLSTALTAWLVITWAIALWAFVTGFSNIFQAFSGHDSTGYKALLVIAGLIALALGIVVLANPLYGTATVVYILGIFLIVWGIIIAITGIMNRS